MEHRRCICKYSKRLVHKTSNLVEGKIKMFTSWSCWCCSSGFLSSCSTVYPMVFSNNLPFENEFAEKPTRPILQNLTLSEVYMGLLTPSPINCPILGILQERINWRDIKKSHKIPKNLKYSKIKRLRITNLKNLSRNGFSKTHGSQIWEILLKSLTI